MRFRLPVEPSSEETGKALDRALPTSAAIHSSAMTMANKVEVNSTTKTMDKSASGDAVEQPPKEEVSGGGGSAPEARTFHRLTSTTDYGRLGASEFARNKIDFLSKI